MGTDSINETSALRFASDAEREWVERFVRSGGIAKDGLDTYRRMADQSRPSKPRITPAPVPSTTPLFTDLEKVGEPERSPTPAPAPHKPKSTHTAKPAVSAPTPSQPELAFENLEDQARTLAPAPATDVPPAGELGFVTASMVFAALPHRAVKSGFYKRKTGDITLSVMNDPEIGIPYGRYPRLLLAHICTLAKKTQESRLYLGDSQTDFLRRLGLTSTDSGGERSQMALVRQRTIQLLTSAIRVNKAGDDKFSFMNIQVADQGSLIWTPHTNDGGMKEYKWQGFIDLSTPFFQQCVNHGYPIDLQVIKNYRSSLAIDIYIWLTYRMNYLKKPLEVSWDQLKFQFGSEYADDALGIKNFRGKFRAQLALVLKDYPSARVDDEHTDKFQGLILRPSPPHVMPR